MAATKPRPARRTGPAAPSKLPPLSVARFEQAMLLVESIVDENTDLFISRMHAYRERARAGSSRALTAAEAANVAAMLAESLGADANLVEVAEEVQSGSMRAVDEPAAIEVLAAAGVATAPAAMRAGLRLLALIEMPADEFEQAYEDGTLDAAIEKSMITLRALDVEDARARASSALEYLAQKAGAGSGEGVRLLIQSVWQALNQAAQEISPMISSGLSSLTDSQPPTDGASGASSTAFAGSAR